MKNEWKIRFGAENLKGREVPLGRCFSWNSAQGSIPAAYISEKGILLDICMEYDRESYRAYLNRFRDLFDREGKINNQRMLRFQQEDPMDCYFRTELLINGNGLKHYEGHGMRWVPKALEPIISDEVDMQPVMERYGLAKDKVWQFRREAFQWESEADPLEGQWELLLRQWPQMHLAQTFELPQTGQQATVKNPLTGMEHRITVTDIQRKRIQKFRKEHFAFPENCLVMAYTLEPELPAKNFFLRDTAESDPPRETETDSAVTCLTSDDSRPEGRYAVSSLHFDPVETVTWQAVFRAKTTEDIRITLR